jgi:pilus assembly protein Flp/PilA
MAPLPRRHRGSAKRRRAPFRSDEGASAVEYALIVFAIAAVIAIVVVALGSVVNDSVNNSCNTIKQTLNSDTAAKCVP